MRLLLVVPQLYAEHAQLLEFFVCRQRSHFTELAAALSPGLILRADNEHEYQRRRGRGRMEQEGE